MMREDDVRNILAFEHTMIGSDGIPLGERPHPRPTWWSSMRIG
jgi:N-acyl-D-amino-acid deacylase